DTQYVAFSPDGKTLASGGIYKPGIESQTIKLWNVQSGNEIHNLAGQPNVMSVAFSADGKTLASGTKYGATRSWNVQTGQEINSHKGSDFFSSLVLSNDGKMLAAGS